MQTRGMCTMRCIRRSILACLGLGLMIYLWLLIVAYDPRQVTRNTPIRLSGAVLSSEDSLSTKGEVKLDHIASNSNFENRASATLERLPDSDAQKFNKSNITEKKAKSSHKTFLKRSSEKVTEKVDSWRKSIIAKKTVTQKNNTIDNTRGKNDTISIGIKKANTEKKQKHEKQKRKSSSQRKKRTDMTEEDKKRIKQGKELNSLFADVDSNWKFNPKSLADFRKQLAILHTAANFTLTKQNAPLNSWITYATLRGKREVTTELHRKLPEKPPEFQTGRFRNCSVVGSSGILTGSGCGTQIDSTEFVIRFEYLVSEANKKKFIDFLSSNYPNPSFLSGFVGNGRPVSGESTVTRRSHSQVNTNQTLMLARVPMSFYLRKFIARSCG
ncbi:uncharacterized protein LOC144928008 isoform X2 [Branchiostoma floridae x Branchiostoma belcheri]